MSDMPPPSVPPAYTPPPPTGGGSYNPPPPPGGGGAYIPPPPPPSGPASSDRTIMIVLSYLGILALIPLFVKKDDREVQWHARNGLALFVAYFILIILWAVVQHFMPAGVGCGLSFVSCVLWLGYLALCIMGIMKGLKGERLRFPVISDFADKM